MSKRPQLIVPSGTQVVTLMEFKDKDGSIVIPKGAVGVILAAPTDNFHSYRLRFADGKEGNFLRRELAIRKLEQDLRAKGAIKWKHAMHLVRLLLQGKSILAEGLVPQRIRFVATQHGLAAIHLDLGITCPSDRGRV